MFTVIQFSTLVWKYGNTDESTIYHPSVSFRINCPSCSYTLQNRYTFSVFRILPSSGRTSNSSGAASAFPIIGSGSGSKYVDLD